MRRVEGVNASYIGPSSDGIRTGDRCRIISDEGALQHVRWLTGAYKDQYGHVRPRDLAPDLQVVGAYEDEFGFEAGRSPKAMAINVTAVHRAGGTVALLEAMESEGHLESLAYVAQEAVEMVRTAIANDEAWDRVREALGVASQDVERQAIVAALIVATEGNGGYGEDGE